MKEVGAHRVCLGFSIIQLYRLTEETAAVRKTHVPFRCDAPRYRRLVASLEVIGPVPFIRIPDWLGQKDNLYNK